MSAKPHTPLVVVGIDGSSHAERALAWAVDYAHATDATLRIVAAWDTPHFFGRSVPREGYEPAQLAHDLIAKAAADLDLPSERFECVARVGPAGEVLVDASADADLLVIGAHGHNPAYTILLGSTAGHCLHHSAAPVAIVR